MDFRTSGVTSSGGGSGSAGSWYGSGVPMRLGWSRGTGNKKVSIPWDVMWYAQLGQQKDYVTNLSGQKWAFLNHSGVTWTGSFSGMNKDKYIIWPVVDVLYRDGGLASKNSISSLPGDWVTYLKGQGAKSNGYAYVYKGKRVDAMSITSYPIKKPQKVTSSKKTTIVKVTNPGDPTNNFDNISKGLTWNFKNARTAAPYSGQSKDKEYNYSNKITDVVYEIKETVTWPAYTYQSNQKDPGYKNPKYTYSKTEKKYENTFKYTMVQPEPDTMLFAPFNLNKSNGTGNGAMTSDEDTTLIKKHLSEYNGAKNGKALDIIPDNRQDIVDGKPLNTLDTNAPVKFNVNWSNDQFGLPTSELKLHDSMPGNGWDWIPHITGNWTAEGSYKKGKTDLTGSKTNTQYYSGNLTAGSSTEDSSLSYNGGQEQIGPSAIPITRPNDGQTDEFAFRTTVMGKYNLINGDKNIPFITVNIFNVCHSC